jgi:hypothetical protein
MLEGGLRQVQGRGPIALVATALVFVGFQAMGVGLARGAEGCPNGEIRVQQGMTELPACRAYEMVTPVPKGSGEPRAQSGEASGPDRLFPIGGARSSLDGQRLGWVSEPLPSARASGVSQLATRQASGWINEDVVPALSPHNDLACPNLLGVAGWSSDLTGSVLDLPAGPPATNEIAPSGFYEEPECGHDEPRLVPGEPEHFRNLFLRDNLTGTYQLVNVTPDDVIWPEPEENLQQYWPASLLAASEDLTHVVFEEELALNPDAPIGYRGGDELYEWVGGQVRLVTVLPDGTPVPGSLAGATRNYFPEPGEARAFNVAQFRRAISADGSRISFEAEGSLFLREDGTRTLQVDESDGPDPSGGGRFMLASADGSRVFFLADTRLTADSTAGPGEPDLYEFRLLPDGSTSLLDVTVNSGEPANVMGVSGASETGDHVYFVARGSLTSTPNSEGDVPVAGEANLYLVEEGVITFVATLDSFADGCGWTADAACAGEEAGGASGITARVSRNGEFLGFNSVRSLTGYDNSDPESGEPHLEIFLFNATTSKLSCASCIPSGEPPRGGAALRWPASPGLNGNWSNGYPQRHVSDRGQVFFETEDALLPADGNGVTDVYEYLDGAVHLLSTGSDESGSHFLDATPDGNDVFFVTDESLLPRDIDTLPDYYDAKVDGGFSEPPPPSPPCDSSSCRDSGTSAGGQLPATNSFVGPGNVPPRKRRCRPRHRRQKANRAQQSSAKRVISRARKCKRSTGRRGAAK